MPKGYQITIEQGINQVVLFENPDFDMLKEINDQLLNNAEHLYLWDLSQVKFNVSTEDIKAIAQYTKEKFSYQLKVAIYTEQDLAYGQMRQFLGYRADSELTTHHVFRSKQQAIDWLLSE